MAKKRKSKKGNINKKKKDLITGSWNWDGGDTITFHVNSGNAPYKTYFGVGQGGSLRNQQGYADSNYNGIYEPDLDLYVGNGLHTPLITNPGDTGPFTANTKTGLAQGFKGQELAGTIEGAGFWFTHG
jgi:hypothetical protein